MLSRRYNPLASGLESPGVFGPGWASVLDQHLEGCRGVMADGRAGAFPEGNGWGRGVGENYWLTHEPSTVAGLSELSTLPAAAPDALLIRDKPRGLWAYSLAVVGLIRGLEVQAPDTFFICYPSMFIFLLDLMGWVGTVSTV